MIVLLTIAIIAAVLFTAFALGCVVYYFHNRDAADLGHVLNRFLDIEPLKLDHPDGYRATFRTAAVGEGADFSGASRSQAQAVHLLLTSLFRSYRLCGSELAQAQAKAEEVTREVVVELNQFKRRVHNANAQVLANARTIIKVLGG